MGLAGLKTFFVAAPRFGALAWLEGHADAPQLSLVAAWRRHGLTPPFHARALQEAADASLDDLLGFRLRRGEGVWWVAPAQLARLDALRRAVAEFPPARLERLALTDEEEARHTLSSVVQRALEDDVSSCRDGTERLLSHRATRSAELVRASHALQRLQQRAELAEAHFGLHVEVAPLVTSLTARLESALTARVVA